MGDIRVTNQIKPRFASRTAAAHDTLWAEHGWSLTAADVAILVIAVSVASACLALLG